MGLAGKTGNSPTGGNTLVTLTLSYTNDINVLILSKDRVNSDFLLEEGLGKINLGTGVGSSVNLNFHGVGLFEAKIEFLHLGVGDNTYNSAEFGNAVKLGLNVLSTILRPLLGVLSVSLPLAPVPVLVATTLELVT